MDLDAPVILLGRGGSGTRLMSRLADPEQLFIGNYINRTGDSLEWVDTIYSLAIARLTGAEPANAADQLRQTAQGILDARVGGNETAWGWKLPETLLILPWVIEAFPRAKVVFLLRHPVTTATGKPHVTAVPHHRVGREVLRQAYAERGLALEDAINDPHYIREAISWNYQIRGALSHISHFEEQGRLHLLRYETMCEDVTEAMAGFDDFTGLNRNDREGPAIDTARLRTVDMDDPKTAQIWSIVAETAAAIGYGPQGPEPVGAVNI